MRGPGRLHGLPSKHGPLSVEGWAHWGSEDFGESDSHRPSPGQRTNGRVCRFGDKACFEADRGGGPGLGLPVLARFSLHALQGPQRKNAAS